MYRAALTPVPSRLERFTSLLSAEEHARASRFLFQDDRERFTIARGLLRTILGTYLEADPARLSFAYGPQGKPFLAPEWADSALSFNLSHSADLFLLGISANRHLGVDLEQIRSSVALSKIAERFFCADELAAIRTLPDETEGFFGCWTLKEAVIKAVGRGLSLPLNTFDVSRALLDGTASFEMAERMCSPVPDESTPHRWRLQRLTPGPGYAGAICVEGEDWQLSCFEQPLNHTVGAASL